MNKQSIEQMFRNYIDNFDYFESSIDGHETYKWDAIGQVQDVWDLSAADLSGMIRKAFSKTYNLINNRIVSPGNGLALVAAQEPETVRKALEELLADTEDEDEKQEKCLRFVDEINALLKKYYPDKWRYEQDERAAITYLSLIDPYRNYLYKSSPAHYFAEWMRFSADIGYGKTFKLRYYYQMCDELLAEVNACPELMAKNAERKCGWKDRSNHVLVTDLIYCFGVYDFMRKGIDAPPPRARKASAEARAAERARMAEELQGKLDGLQDEVDALEQEIAALPVLDFAGKTIRTKAFGEVAVNRQEGNYLYFTKEGKERFYVLPKCITNGFVVTEDQDLMERCVNETELLDKIDKLGSQQRLLLIELKKY